jgi:hypothetical protein
MAVKQLLLWLAHMGNSIESTDAAVATRILLGLQHIHVGSSVDGTSCG